MKFLVLFAATLLCVQAYHMPYGYYDTSISSESSEEEYHVLVTSRNHPPLSLPGVGVYNQPILQAVKVKVPRYISPEIKQQIIRQTLAARGLTPHAAPPPQSGIVTVAPAAGQQHELPAVAAVNSGVAVGTGTVADNIVVTDERKAVPTLPATAAGLSLPVLQEVPAHSVFPDVATIVRELDLSK